MNGIRDLSQLMEAARLSQSDISAKMGWSKAQVSRIASKDYPNWEENRFRTFRF